MESLLATIQMFGFNFNPRGWVFCNGQLMSIAQNTALFSLLGTTYGGDGRTTFAIPDLRGRTPIGFGEGPGLPDYQLGEMAGTTQVTLTTANLPAHTHMATVQIGVASGIATTDEIDGAVLTNTANNFYAPASSVNSRYGSATAAITPMGGNQPLNIEQPYLVVNFCICTVGIFPSRN